jgi:hypothetical protein
MDESIKLFSARIVSGLILIVLTTLIILAYQEYSAELAKDAELYVVSSLNQFDSSLAVK